MQFQDVVAPVALRERAGISQSRIERHQYLAGYRVVADNDGRAAAVADPSDLLLGASQQTIGSVVWSP